MHSLIHHTTHTHTQSVQFLYFKGRVELMRGKVDEVSIVISGKNSSCVCLCVCVCVSCMNVRRATPQVCVQRWFVCVLSLSGSERSVKHYSQVDITPIKCCAK